MLDIFNSTAFSVTRLTQAINQMPVVPGRLGELGLFSVDRVNVTSVAIEQRAGLLSLIKTTPRGGPGDTTDKSTRNMRSLLVPHFQHDDAVMAEEVQGIRAFGSETQLETVMQKVADRMAENTSHFDATEEYCRVGAVKGEVVYPAGSVDANLNLFTEFGVNQINEVDFDLDNANPTAGALRKKCASVTRSIKDELGMTVIRGVHAICGDAFFDDLLAHKEVRETYLGWSEAKILREGYISNSVHSVSAFEFGGIVWENYSGSVGGADFVNTDKCHIFPVGVPGLFKTVYAPADYIETVNTRGERLYSKQIRMRNDKGIELEMQMNALHYCSRPRALLKGKRT